MTQASGTGRYLVLLTEGATDAGARALTDAAGIRAVSTADAGTSGMAQALAEANGLVFHDLDLCLVRADPDQFEALNRAATPRGPIAMVEPERTVYAIGEPRQTENNDVTWGLRAVNAPASSASGAGRRVAVLDTGFDAEHPDYDARTIVADSFVDGADPHDAHGHGTHVIGTACGPRAPGSGPGYGVAYQSEIYSGKVLDDDGSGTDGGILAGISWAIQHDCSVVSMSLGSPVQPDEPYSETFEQAAMRAMRRGTLVIAAAGNESRRDQGHIAPVGHPANCPTILAVGAIDGDREIADFSSGTVGDVGQVDLVAPGVDIHSSWPMPERTNSASGTSMAAPHVSGVAALLAEVHDARSWELWARMSQRALRLPVPSTDGGAGLVQAP